ncbi:DHA2 family efflux MFS transporter permease subunit [Hymenobacter sp. 15J16-1T3B]|uniref:DHA2 family efflux MFS transporter permease subunit n=1 Tax=Hymenobacter sp. 15J16-1T3B TaxID=2886941 RepID=UPI001D123894|nr:DHA2 family efflux MFS transporter permease subunit [Hymenobacter sp. 15J16-1T3B]MCC3158431.1 DHA2 family efflux MFS transporter permease subunit [Hymenobacter sp. 15J16-1T3B]
MSSLRLFLLCATVICAAVMELIDTSIVNVALSHLSGNLGATLADTSWVITAYAIANIIVIPITSYLATRLGRRRYFIGSVVLFTLASAFCGTATNIWVLVAFRFVQGLGGGALLSTSQAIVFEAFPPAKRGIAAALFGIGVFTGPTIGPTLGGYILDVTSWHWIFLVNVPIGIIVAIASFLLVPEPAAAATPARTQMDWLGLGLLVLGVGSLQVVLERGQEEDWFETPYILQLSVAAALGLVGFVWWELRTAQPIVNLRVLKSRSLAVAAVLTFVTGLGLFTSVYLTPVFAQRLLHFPVLDTGLLLVPGAVAAIIVLLLTARALQRGVPVPLIVGLGFLLFVTFSWRMSLLTGAAGTHDFYLPLILRGVGIALLTVPLTALAVSGLPVQDIAQGAALNNMMRQLGGSFGIALVNTYLATQFAVHRQALVTHLTAGDLAVAERLNGTTQLVAARLGEAPVNAVQRAYQLLDGRVNLQAGIQSYNDAFLLVGGCFLAAMPLLLLVLRTPRPAPSSVPLSDH